MRIGRKRQLTATGGGIMDCLKMTPSQKKAVKFGVDYVFRDRAMSPEYELFSTKIEWLEYTRSVHVILTIHNGKPGTYGYEFPITASFFVGKNGGYSCYQGDKRITGKKALTFA